MSTDAIETQETKAPQSLADVAQAVQEDDTPRPRKLSEEDFKELFDEADVVPKTEEKQELEVREAKKPAPKKKEELESDIDDALIDRALDAGLSLTETRKFKSADDLKMTLRLVQSERKQREDMAAAIEAERARLEAESQKKEEPQQAEGFTLSEDDDISPESINRVMAGIDKKYTGTIKALEEKVESLNAYIQHQEQQKHLDWFDQKFAGLPEYVKEKIGDKKTFDYSDRDSEFELRRSIIQAVIDHRRRRPNASLDEIFDREVRAEFGVEDPRVLKNREQKRQVIMRPSVGKGTDEESEEDPSMELDRVLAAMHRANGHTV